MNLLYSLVVVSVLFVFTLAWDDHTNRIPTKCETCKLMAIELTEALRKLDSNEELDSRFRLDDDFTKRKSKKYKDS
jgi:hypothetical protein